MESKVEVDEYGFALQTDPKTKIFKDIFWAIEKMDPISLKRLLKESPEYFNKMYFNSGCWWDIFTAKECEQIRVEFSGQTDFTPFQHAMELEWVYGAYLIYQEGLAEHYGSGLPIYSKLNELFKKDDIRRVIVIQTPLNE